MIEVLRALQVLFVLAWAVPLVLFRDAPLRRARTDYDRLRTATWWTGFTMALFPLRWLIFPASYRYLPLNESASWAALYVLGVVAAGFLTLAVWRVSHERD